MYVTITHNNKEAISLDFSCHMKGVSSNIHSHICPTVRINIYFIYPESSKKYYANYILLSILSKYAYGIKVYEDFLFPVIGRVEADKRKKHRSKSHA